MSQTCKSNLNTEQTLHNKAIGATSVAEVPSISTPPDARDQTSEIQHLDISPGECLLRALWRSPERHHQLGTLDRKTNKFNNLPVKDAADATAQALSLSHEGTDTYFACAEYFSVTNRTAANAAHACGFWSDIDCGEEKAKAGKGYATVKDAEDALQKFCQEAGLPKPTHIVNSGAGLHIYWVLDKAVNSDEWQLAAGQLKAVAKACGFRADPARTSDIASVLRVPGTFNYKYSPPKPVTLIRESSDYIAQSVMLDAIATAHDRLCYTPTPTTHRASTGAVTTASVHARGVLDLDRLASALAVLNPDCDEETWKLKRLAPLALAAHEHPEWNVEIYELARSWSSGELRGEPSIAWVTPGGNGLTGEEVFDEVWDRFLNTNYTGTPVTIGTIYHDAKQAGWGPDEFQVLNDEGGK